MKREYLPHLVIFIICFGILAGCLILSPPDEDNPYIKIGNISLPGMCTFRSVTGIPCPGCGLFRSMVTAMHGDIAGSLTYHRLGFITILYVFIQFLFRLGILIFPSLAVRFGRIGSFLNRGVILLAIVFGANWILTLIRLF